MSTQTSNIDDVLLGAHTRTQPATPEYQEPVHDEPEAQEIETSEEPVSYEAEAPLSNPDDETPETKQTDSEIDDYGNEKTRDNDVIRERLARQAESLKRQHQAELDALRAQLTPNQQQQVAENFQYDENSNQSWDQQLRQFVEQTVRGMTERQQQEAQRVRDMQAIREFETKFTDDMTRFPDFEQVIGSVAAPITDPMVHATRGMKNPAAFLYAAAKRAPQELQRISNIQDPYVQISEMGRLEATLRQTKPGTKAPRPLGKTQEDSAINVPDKARQPSIEELILQSDKRKLALVKQRRGR